MTDTFIDVFEKSCIYREFINDSPRNSHNDQVELQASIPCSTLLIIAYFYDTNKFYQTKISSTEWESYSKNFTLQELEMIFKVCFNKISGYNLSIDADDSHLNLVFKCREIIKTYEWTITLKERINLEKELVQDHIKELQLLLENKQEQLLGKKIKTLGESADDILFFRNKELSMIPYISKIPQHREKLDNNNPYQKAVECALDNEYDDCEDTVGCEDTNDILSDNDEYNLISKNRCLMNSYLPRSSNNILAGGENSTEESESDESENESDENESNENDSNEDDDRSADSDDNFEYRSFMKTKINDLKKLYPGMYKTYYRQYAEREWNKHLKIKKKDTN